MNMSRWHPRSCSAWSSQMSVMPSAPATALDVHACASALNSAKESRSMSGSCPRVAGGRALAPGSSLTPPLLPGPCLPTWWHPSLSRVNQENDFRESFHVMCTHVKNQQRQLGVKPPPTIWVNMAQTARVQPWEVLVSHYFTTSGESEAKECRSPGDSSWDTES